MTIENDLVQLLQAQIDAAGLQFEGKPAKIAVVEWTISRPAMFDQYLVRLNPDGTRNDAVVAVRQLKDTASRYLQVKPHTNQTDYEIAVWLLVFYRENAEAYAVLREAIVNRVRNYFVNNPGVAQYKTCFVDDHLSGKSYNLASLITVTKTFRR